MNDRDRTALYVVGTLIAVWGITAPGGPPKGDLAFSLLWVVMTLSYAYLVPLRPFRRGST